MSQLPSAWRRLIHPLLVAVLVSLVVLAGASPFMTTPALAATSTSFSPTSVNLTTGQSTTITITAVGLAAGDTAAQFGIVHTANTTISNPACVGIFAGANPNQAVQANGDLLTCTFGAGGASGPNGNVMTFTLTNTGGAAETISFNTAALSGGAVAPCLLGDINCDGIVDIQDYGIWRQNFGRVCQMVGATVTGDLDGNCIVDARDYTIWRQNLGHTTGAVGTTFYLSNTFTVDPAGALSTLSVTIPTVTNTPTVTATLTATPTLSLTPITVVGQAVQYTGAVSGQWIKTGSGSYSFTATGPPNAAPGGTPSLSLSTTVGSEGGPCTAVGSSAPFTTTCTGTTVGDVLLSASVSVSFPLSGGSTFSVSGSPVATVLLADINGDSIVDIRDYGIWRQNFGTSNCDNPADLNLDCIVDIRDYGIWRQNFGHTAGPGATRLAPRAAPPSGTATPTPSRTPTGR
jgi:uncharacterized protein (DUF2141 family)